MIQQFADLRRDELEALSPDLTLFIFPMGGFEQHGAHLPLGTKWFVAEQNSKILAEMLQAKMPHWSFIVMPTAPFTVDTVTSKWAFPVRAHVVRDYLVDQCRGLKRFKFSKFAVYSSHITPRQLSAIEEAGKIISRRENWITGHTAQFISISSNDVKSSDIMKSPMIANPREHAGAVETALMLRLKPNRVSKDYVNLSDQPQPKETVGRLISYFRRELDGYWGKPKDAQPDLIYPQVQSALEKTALQMQAVLESGRGSSLFNSGYRYFFFNGSFFKAYLMGAIFFVMMIIWTLWSLKDVFES